LAQRRLVHVLHDDGCPLGQLGQRPEDPQTSWVRSLQRYSDLVEADVLEVCGLGVGDRAVRRQLWTVGVAVGAAVLRIGVPDLGDDLTPSRR
jgi:hypothetical protein